MADEIQISIQEQSVELIEVRVDLNSAQTAIDAAAVALAAAESVNLTLLQLITVGTITVAGTIVTVPSGASWKIAGTIYTTATDTVITIPLAVSGKNRIDILVANGFGTIVVVSGAETTGLAVRPNIPANTVLITEINVSDNSIADPTIPITGADFIAKAEKIRIVNNETGIIDINFSDEKAIIHLKGTVTTIKSANTSDLYFGKKFAIKNEQSTNVTIQHNSVTGGGNTLFNFPNEVDFILKPNETIEFLFNKSNNYYLDFIGRISVGSNIDQTVIENSTNAVSGAGVFAELANKLDNSTTLAEPFLTDKLIIKQAPGFTESKEITLADLKTLIGGIGAAKKYAFIQPSLDNGQYDTANVWYGVPKYTAGYDSGTAVNLSLTGTNLYNSAWKGFIPPFVNSKVISGKFVFQWQPSAINSVFEVLLVKADFPNGQSVETPLNYEVVSRTITNQIQQVLLGLFTINLTINAHTVFNANSFYFWAFKNNSATFYRPLGIAFEFQEQ